MATYATEADVYALAMRAAAFVPSPRVVASVSGSTFTLGGHGLSDGDEIRFSLEGDAIEGGAAPALPAPLSAATVYYVANASADLFQVSTSSGGAAVALTDDGEGVFGIVVSPVPVIRRLCRHWSANVDGACKAHSGFVVDGEGNYPEEVVGIVARCAARDAIRILGLDNPTYSDNRNDLFMTRKWDEEWFAERRRGVPVKGAGDASPTVSEMSPRYRVLDGAATTDWGTSGEGVV